jgi:hypothetical protein
VVVTSEVTLVVLDTWETGVVVVTSVTDLVVVSCSHAANQKETRQMQKIKPLFFMKASSNEVNLIISDNFIKWNPLFDDNE